MCIAYVTLYNLLHSQVGSQGPLIKQAVKYVVFTHYYYLFFYPIHTSRPQLSSNHRFIGHFSYSMPLPTCNIIYTSSYSNNLINTIETLKSTHHYSKRVARGVQCSPPCWCGVHSTAQCSMQINNHSGYRNQLK